MENPWIICIWNELIPNNKKFTVRFVYPKMKIKITERLSGHLIHNDIEKRKHSVKKSGQFITLNYKKQWLSFIRFVIFSIYSLHNDTHMLCVWVTFRFHCFDALLKHRFRLWHNRTFDKQWKFLESSCVFI